MSNQQQLLPKLVTSRYQILHSYQDVFEVIRCFPGPLYHTHLDPSNTLKQTSCRPIPVHLKEAFKQDIDKLLKVWVLKPVHEATPWINSFVLVEGKHKTGNLKLRIYLDPTILNEAIVRGPYHLKAPEDIARLLADACIMSVCDCKKS